MSENCHNLSGNFWREKPRGRPPRVFQSHFAPPPPSTPTPTASRTHLRGTHPAGRCAVAFPMTASRPPPEYGVGRETRLLTTSQHWTVLPLTTAHMLGTWVVQLLYRRHATATAAWSWSTRARTTSTAATWLAAARSERKIATMSGGHIAPVRRAPRRDLRGAVHHAC